MPSYALGVTYNGTHFHGWQRQAQVRTVQGELEQALSKIANQPINLLAAGRTDAGVHATGQVAAFVTSAERSLHTWQRGLNGLTSKEIHVDWVVSVPANFHPRYSAAARAYHYVYHDIGRIHPMLVGQVWGCDELDADAMHRAAQCLVGEHDFSAFRGAGCQSLTPMRRVNRIQVVRRGERVVFEIEANAFVLHMVRNIASALHTIGRGEKLDLPWLLASKDRTLLGMTAPADGLYLTSVTYPQHKLPLPASLAFMGL